MAEECRPQILGKESVGCLNAGESPKERVPSCNLGRDIDSL